MQTASRIRLLFLACAVLPAAWFASDAAAAGSGAAPAIRASGDGEIVLSWEGGQRRPRPEPPVPPPPPPPPPDPPPPDPPPPDPPPPDPPPPDPPPPDPPPPDPPPPDPLPSEYPYWNATAHEIAAAIYGWDFHEGGAGVIVGIVDSGVDLDHAEFLDANGNSRLLTGACFSGGTSICSGAGNSVGGDEGVFPSQITHGTHVAGIAAGLTTGLAYEASILPVKVCSSFSSSCPGDINSAVVWASLQGARIINLSLGGGGLTTSAINAFQQAIANGALFVVAAGNGGNSRQVSGYAGGAATRNGVRGAMIVVGATASDGTIASFSQVPGTGCTRQGGNIYCTRDYFVVAPGYGIYSAVGGGGYGRLSGTSMATPYVTGVAALIAGAWPSLTPYDIADIIFSTAVDVGAPGVDNVYGRGAVDVTAALAPVGGTSVIVVTGGTPDGYTGAANALGTLATGPLAAAFARSSVLADAVVLDRYGRDFGVDLRAGARASGFSVSRLAAAPTRSVSPFAVSARNLSFGALHLSGAMETRTDPLLETWSFQNELATVREVADFVVAAEFAPGFAVEFGHNAQFAQPFYGAHAGVDRAGLFFTGAALAAPFASFAAGGDYAAAELAVTGSLTLRLAHQSLAPEDRGFDAATLAGMALAGTSWDPVRLDGREAEATQARLAWDFASWGTLAGTLSRSVERNSFLGGVASGAFAAFDDTITHAVDLSLRLDLGDGWETALAWSEGISIATPAANGLVRDADAMSSRAWGLALSKRELFGADRLVLGVTRPVHVYDGTAVIEAGTRGADGAVVFAHELLDFASPTPETDIEIGYQARLMDGAMSFEARGAYQFDVDGFSGRDAVAAFARASFAF